MELQCFLGSSQEERRLALFLAGGGGVVTPPDTTAPTLLSATIPSAGTSVTLLFDESVLIGAGGNTGWTITMSGGAATLTYSSGSGTDSLVYTLSRTVNSGETGPVAYTQPGNGVEDASGNDLASIVSHAVTNNSTQIGYLVNQNFEGAGYDNGETWTEVGTVDPNWTTSPIVGAQSLHIAVDNSYTYTTFAPQTTCYLYFRYRCDSVAGNLTNFGLYQQDLSELAVIARTLTPGAGQEVRIGTASGNGAVSSTILDNGTNYHVWVDFIAGGTLVLRMSTNGVKPSVDGSGNVYLTRAAEAATAGAVVFFIPTTGGAHTFDHVLVSTTPIGDNP